MGLGGGESGDDGDMVRLTDANFEKEVIILSLVTLPNRFY